LLPETFKNNSAYQNGVIQRLIQIARKYRKDLEPLLSKIEDDFLKLEIPEVQKAFINLKHLK